MKFLTLSFLLIFFPSVAFASIRINEIAWMGIEGVSGQFGEWIELFNDGETTDLNGWKIYSAGGSDLLFTLTKSIQSSGYLLIERTTASMPDPLPTIDDESGAFGAGGLSNSAENLVLKDSNGNVVQTLDFSSGWPAGSSDTKETMQWNGSGWITAAPTPKSPTISSSPVEEKEQQEIVTVKESGKSAPRTVNPYVKISIPQNVYSHITNKYSAEIQLKEGVKHPMRGIYKWNFGDGTAFEQTDKLNPVTHSYKYPGRYTIWFGYYPSIFSNDPEISSTETVNVTVPEISVSVIDRNTILIVNETDELVDLSGWMISSFGSNAKIPEMTILSAGGRIYISSDVLGIAFASNTKLLLPDGSPLSTFVNKNISQTEAVPDIEEVRGENKIANDISEFFEEPLPQKQNHTKEIIFGVVATIIIGLFVLLERFMARQE